MSDNAKYIGRFSLIRAGSAIFLYGLFLSAVLFAGYSSVLHKEGDPANRVFFIVAIPIFLILFPGVFYQYCGKPAIRAFKFHGNFCKVDCERIEFCSVSEPIPVVAIGEVFLRRRRPKGRLYSLEEAVFLPTDKTKPETIVGLFYLSGDRADFVSELATSLRLDVPRARQSS